MAEQGVALEPFLILARSTKGAAAAKIVSDVTAAPGVYVFAEFLEMPNIQQLSSDPKLSNHYQLLQLFAYGTLKDYENNQSIFPPLNDAHITKLKHLTLVSLALQHRSLKYDIISSTLGLQGSRQVEDLVIDVIYAGLLTGKLHHDTHTFHIDSVSGRDLCPEDLTSLETSLQNWATTAQTLLGALDTQISLLRQTAANEYDEVVSYNTIRDEAYLTAVNDLRKEKEEKRLKKASNQDQNDGRGLNLPPYHLRHLREEMEAPPSGRHSGNSGDPSEFDMIDSAFEDGEELAPMPSNSSNVGGSLHGGRNNPLARNVSGRSDDTESTTRASKRPKD